jgi:hypothetical protein
MPPENSWCSENEFFGDSTVFNQADRMLTFDQQVRPEANGTTILTSAITVELIPQRGGNLPTHQIPRSQF